MQLNKYREIALLLVTVLQMSIPEYAIDELKITQFEIYFVIIYKNDHEA